jgi:hypothetical protein
MNLASLLLYLIKEWKNNPKISGKSGSNIIYLYYSGSSLMFSLWDRDKVVKVTQ